MNLKYYLRGLGIGIIVTALIMGIAFSGKKETLSDSEIIERAKALGMIEESTLIADVAAENLNTNEKEPDPATTAQPAASALATAAVVSTPEAVATPVPTEAPQPTETPVSAAESQPTEAPALAAESELIEENLDVITIQINSGDGSYSACKQLEEAGLVESASVFDRYLYDNGYDKRINVGTFEIPLDADPEQIAKILARLE